jgi:hypothetical protein
MALQPIESMKKVGYLKEVGEFVEWAAHYVEENQLAGQQGWLEHLEAYEWKNVGWCEGIHDRMRLAKRFETLWRPGLLSRFDQAVKQTLEWGGMKPFGGIKSLQDSCTLLDQFSNKSAASNWEKLHEGRIATVSKVYEMYDLDSWIIYDSRVSRVLARLARKWWDKIGSEECERWLRFPQARGRSGDKPEKGFHLASDKQANLAFIYASWIAQAIAKRLNEMEIMHPQTDPKWRTFHIEMVLFTLGRAEEKKYRVD